MILQHANVRLAAAALPCLSRAPSLSARPALFACCVAQESAWHRARVEKKTVIIGKEAAKLEERVAQVQAGVSAAELQRQRWRPWVPGLPPPPEAEQDPEREEEQEEEQPAVVKRARVQTTALWAMYDALAEEEAPPASSYRIPKIANVPRPIGPVPLPRPPSEL